MHKKIYQRAKKAPQFLKFFFIGGFFAFSDLVILYVLTDIFGWFYLYSALFGFILITSLAFIVHKTFTFQCKREDRLRQYIFFFLVNTLGLGIYSWILYAGVEYLGIFYLYVAVIDKFIVFIWNFLANKFITFRIIHCI
ncbi:MAG: GtrA family protein [uncultured bacterium (gcode 4)]|uniref:GtrA family protein n=1 Tax=uncultured bacterium (gcode 4) TaxID=1234023 RepID=K1XXQ8_9BACT|nr:MAG: GtrA family protein [uncultured bacterium (gcode 4)]